MNYWEGMYWNEDLHGFTRMPIYRYPDGRLSPVPPEMAEFVKRASVAVRLPKQDRPQYMAVGY